MQAAMREDSDDNYKGLESPAHSLNSDPNFGRIRGEFPDTAHTDVRDETRVGVTGSVTP